MTLLPAATEIVAALGDVSVLVGISHECDFPACVQHLPRLTTTPIDIEASGLSIDREVRRLGEAGRPVIAVDEVQLRSLAPDLIITQDLCQVCAVGHGQVRQLAPSLHPVAAVLSLKAKNLAGIWNDIRAVGGALSREAEAEELVLGLQDRLGRLRAPPHPPTTRVLCIEWLDPLYVAGHWMPELIAAAGGIDIGAVPGSHSTQRSWSEVSQLRPDHIVVALCGFSLSRAHAELDSMTDPAALDLMARVPTSIIDGNSYTSRPGPRVVDGATLIRSALLGQANPGVERWQAARVC